MDPILLEWINLALRWLHVIAVIAWIGTSFYFIALELSLRDPGGLPKGVHGEAWQVHGGGFYRMQKYSVAPDELPAHLTWFKWEAYTTWMSGLALLIVLYFLNTSLYLVDPAVLDIGPVAAVVLALVFILAAMIAYEGLLRSPIGRDDGRLALVGFVLIVVLTITATHLFSGRGAFLMVGAAIGSIMVASVANVIIPNQRKVVASLLKGEAPDPRLGQTARQRSLHNNYLTLPVLFTMISNHYPLTHTSRWNWLILVLVFVVGFAVRHFFNERHKGRPSPWWTWGVATAGMAVVVLLAWPAGPQAAVPAGVGYAQAERVLQDRCAPCHAAEPVWEGIAIAPKAVRLDDPRAILREVQAIRLQAVLTRAMPPGNLSGITEEERAILAAWIDQGAPGPEIARP